MGEVDDLDLTVEMDPVSARNREAKLKDKFFTKRKKNTVGFKYDMKLARMPDKQDEVAMA